MCISRNRPVLSLVDSGFPGIFDIVQKQSRGVVLPAQPDTSKNHLRGHHIVTHNYHDHSQEVDDGSPEPVARGGVTIAFPIKLHEMLDKIELDGYGNVVSWQPHGRCFVVHKPKEFVEHIMPTYFKQSKLPSFQRQLNLYGFQRLTKGPDKGGYYHELFLRGRAFLAHRIQRTRVKGTGVRARGNPSMEPNFYNMHSVTPTECHSTPAVAISFVPITPERSPVETPFGPFEDDDTVAEFEGMEFHLVDPEEFDSSLFEDQASSSQQDMRSHLGNLNIAQDLYNEVIEKVDEDVLALLENATAWPANVCVQEDF